MKTILASYFLEATNLKEITLKQIKNFFMENFTLYK